MYTRSDLERITGLTSKQLRARLEALEGILNGQVKVGPRGQKLYPEEIVELVRALDQLAQKEGIPLREAARKLAHTVGNVPKDTGQAEGKLASQLAHNLAPQLARELALWRAIALGSLGAWVVLAFVLAIVMVASR